MHITLTGGGRGTDSWLDGTDIDKILVQICFYCLKYTKGGQLILRRIIKIVATICQILRLKCTKFNFGWGSARRPCWESLQHTPALAGLKVLILRGGKSAFPIPNSWIRHCIESCVMAMSLVFICFYF